MPGGNRVGRVYYDVDAENNVSKGLAAAEGEAQAFTQSINAMEASIEVDADLSELKTDLARARAMARSMESEFKNLELDIGLKKDSIKQMEDLGQNTRKANGELTQMENRYHRLGWAIKRSAAEQKAYQSNIDVRQDEKRLIDRVIKAEKEKARAIEKSTGTIKEQEYAIAKLEDRYVKLHAARTKADRGIRGLHSRADKARLNLVEKEIALTRERLMALGRTKDDVDSLDASLSRNANSFSRWGQSISQARIHLGFFSTTLAGLGRIMVVLGPIITGALGALGSLISVAGAGLAGALAVGAAGFTGFGLAAVGSFIALKPAIQQMGAAFTATKALSDAQLKYGMNSSQAKDKQEQLNNTLKGMDKPARQAFQSLSGMRTQFDKLAGEDIRADFFGSFAEGVKTAKALLPTFAKGSKDAFHAASEGFNDWMKGMRSAEGKNILGQIMDNFSASLPSVMAGLGNLGATFGRITAAASTFLPSLTGGFEKWTQSIEDGIGSGDQLTERVGRWVHAMQQVGHFAQASASALTTFFSIGVGPGGNFLDGMTRSLQRWNNEMKADPTAVRNFFERGIAMWQQLGPAAGRALGLLVKASVTLEPAITATAAVLNTVLDVVSKLPSPVIAAAGALLLFGRSLKMIAGLSALSGIASLFGGAAAAGGGAATGGLMARLFGTAGATAATGQLALFGSRLGATALLFNPYTLGAVAATSAGIGFLAYVNSLSSPLESAGQAMKSFTEANAAIPGAMERNRQSQNAAGQALARYNKLVKQGKGDTQAAHDALVAHANAQQAARQAQADTARETEKQGDAMDSLNDEYQDQLEFTNNMTKAHGAQSMEATQARQDLAGIGAELRLATLNYNRLQHAAEPAGAAMLKSLQQIKNISGRKTALKFRFDDQSVVREVGQLSGKLSRVGRKPVVQKILANSKNADQAYARLLRYQQRLKDKKVKLSAEDQASNKVQHIQGRINALKDKKTKLEAQDSASPKIAQIVAKIQALRDKQVNITVTTTYKQVGSPSPAGGPRAYTGGVIPRGYAAGGVEDRMMERAYARADRRAGIIADRGAKITSPRYVVGEQAPNYNEFIITENPKYRLSNLGYLTMAARALDVPGFGKGGIPKAKKNLRKEKQKDPVGAAARWNQYQDNVDFWSEEYDLDRQSYDSGIGTGGTMVETLGEGLLGQMKFDLQEQINNYVAMIPLANEISKMNKVKNVKAHFKNEGKQKKADKLNERIDNFNSDVDEAKGSLMSERNIRHAIQALELEKLEIDNAASTNTLLGSVTASATRYGVMQQYASNITGAGFGGFGNLGSQSTFSGLTGQAMAARSAGSATPMSAGAAAPRSGGVVVNNTYAAPPPDPHQYSSGLAFELQAVTF